MAHSKKRRSSLFSLSARMRRRAPSPSSSPSPALRHVIINADGSQDADDNCPLCIAAREGKQISSEPMHDPAFLVAEARRVLEREKLAPGEEASIVSTGRFLPDKTFETTSYSVDADGCIYLTQNETRTFVMRISDPTTSS